MRGLLSEVKPAAPLATKDSQIPRNQSLPGRASGRTALTVPLTTFNTKATKDGER